MSESKGMFISRSPRIKKMLMEKARLNTAVTCQKQNSSNSGYGIYNNKLLTDLQWEAICEINACNANNIESETELKEYTQNAIDSICKKKSLNIPEKEKLIVIEAIMDELRGMGPIQKLLSDKTVSEIMINGADQVYIEKNGVLILADVKFRDNQHVMQIIDKMLSISQIKINENPLIFDTKLADGLKVNVIIPPISLKGPIVTIHKPVEKAFTIDDLINNNSVSGKMANFLQLAVQMKANIIIAGSTGSGKTTLLNIISSFIPNSERIITIEDSPELQLSQPHVVSLIADTTNSKEIGEITVKDLLRNSPRMRANRIIVGEIKDSEVLDMLQLMNAGNNGVMSTINADSSKDAISRMEDMILSYNMLFSIRSVREKICSAVDFIVYIRSFKDGTRRVSQISKILGLDGDAVVLQDVFNDISEGVAD